MTSAQVSQTREIVGDERLLLRSGPFLELCLSLTGGGEVGIDFDEAHGDWRIEG